MSREESIRKSKELLKEAKQVLKEAEDEIRHTDLLLRGGKDGNGEFKAARQELDMLAKDLVKTCKQAWKSSGNPESALFAVMKSDSEKGLGYPSQRTEDNLYSALFVNEEPEKDCVQYTLLTVNAKNRAINCSCSKKYFDDIVIEEKAIAYFRPLTYKFLMLELVLILLVVAFLVYNAKF